MVINSILSVLLALLVIGAVLVIIFDDCDSGRKVAWLLVITLFPVVGLILYLMIGINYRHHWYFNRRHSKYLETVRTQGDGRLKELFEGGADFGLVRPAYRPLVTLLATDDANTVTGGNSVEIMTNGKRKFDLLTGDLLDAREYIHIEYFLFGDDEGSRRIKEILMLKARQGVKVRFIHENIANLTIRDSYYNEMKGAGVEVVKFTNPRKHLLNLVTYLNYRDHRKIVVIDGTVGYTGGMNIKDRYFQEWRDTHMRITGKAVASLQSSFMNSWITAGGILDRPYMDYFPAATRLSSPSDVPLTSATARLSSPSDVPLTSATARLSSPSDVPLTSATARLSSPSDVPLTSATARLSSPSDVPLTSATARLSSPSDVPPPPGATCPAPEPVSSSPEAPLPDAARPGTDLSAIDLSGTLPVIHGTLMQVVPDEPDSEWPITQMGYVWAANNAKDYLYLQTPYFVPPEPVLVALKAAALGGVDVRLMLPRKADSAYMSPANKSYFSECLAAGIRIYERGGNFIHAKTFVCDDYLSQIGTANMDYRSFSINYEINTFLFDERAARLNKAIFLQDLELSTEVTPAAWARRPWYNKLWERIIRLFAPLL